jgi:predicted Zn-dependent peptidase
MLRLPGPQKVLLSSGATLLCQKNPISPTIAFGVWIARGSSSEKRNERGLAHLLEHVVFRGTKSRDALRIAYDLETIGGQWDAFTSKESTCYHAKVLEEHFEKLADILADLVCRPSIPDETFRLEKRVVQEEIRSVMDSPEEFAHDLFYETLFAGHPLAHPVTGYLKDVTRHTRRDLADFHRRAYTARDTTLGFVGNLPVATVAGIVEERFRFARRGVAPTVRAPGANARRVRSMRRPEWAQSHLCIGAQVVPASHPDRYPLIVLANILGGGTTSRLFQSLREKTGLVYSVFTSVTFWREAGAISTFFSVDARNVERALDIFHRDLRELREGRVRAEEIESARAQLKGAVVFGMESVDNRLFQMIQSDFYHGRYVSAAEVVRGIERVDRAAVTEAARRYLAPEELSYTTCGPVSLKGLVH